MTGYHRLLGHIFRSRFLINVVFYFQNTGGFNLLLTGFNLLLTVPSAIEKLGGDIPNFLNVPKIFTKLKENRTELFCLLHFYFKNNNNKQRKEMVAKIASSSLNQFILQQPLWILSTKDNTRHKGNYLLLLIHLWM